MEEVDCNHLSARPGRLTSSRRFTCQLPGLDGTIRIAVEADDQNFTLIGGAVRRTVSTESPAELHAAGLLDSRGRSSHAVCALGAAKHFVCDSRFTEPGYRADVEVDLEVARKDRYFIGACRVTALGRRPRSIFACNNLTWSVNMEESTLEDLEEGPPTK